MSKSKKPEAIWTPVWSELPPDTIGACFNADGHAWAWSVKPKILGSEKRPWDLKWRGPEYGQGYTEIGPVPAGTPKARWKDSWVDAPKGRKETRKSEPDGPIAESSDGYKTKEGDQA